MLRFATITLSNPAKPDMVAMELKALITDGDFGLAIGATIASRLELEKIDLREIKEAGKTSPLLVPYVGPVRVTCGGKDVYTGAVNCINGVAIGAQLAHELHLDKEVQNGGGFNQGLLAFGISDKTQEKDRLVQKILIKEQAVDAATCQKICAHVQAQKQKQTGVESVKNSVMPGASSYRVGQDHARDAFSVDTSSISALVRKIHYDLMTQYINPFFGVEVESWERPQLLSYERGGKYDPHADGEVLVSKPAGKRAWQRLHNRDISLILYLNDAFTGGQLKFPDFGVRIQPKPGLLIAFPSTADYLHGVEETQSGDRIVMVTWAAIAGTPRMAGEGENDVFMSSFTNQEKQG